MQREDQNSTSSSSSRGSSSSSSNGAEFPAASSAKRDRKASLRKRSVAVADNNALSIIPGVGPKNASLLGSKDIHDIPCLMKVFLEEHKADSEATKRYLQDTIGIRNKGHIDQILLYLGNQQKSRIDGCDWRVTLSLEGNISAGKSTLLNIIKQNTSDIGDDLTVVPEPVEKWQSLDAGGSKVNMLDEFYKAPERYAYTFQNYVFLTRMTQDPDSCRVGRVVCHSQALVRRRDRPALVQGPPGLPSAQHPPPGAMRPVVCTCAPVRVVQGAPQGGQLVHNTQHPHRAVFTGAGEQRASEAELESRESAKAVRLMERSVFSDRMVFVKAVHAAKYMSDTELAVYDSWFDPVLQSLPSLVPHGFVYLRATPETCHRRMTSRARSEENAVNLGYLQELHECHEAWLNSGSEGPAITSVTLTSDTRPTLFSKAHLDRILYNPRSSQPQREIQIPTLGSRPNRAPEFLLNDNSSGLRPDQYSSRQPHINISLDKYGGRTHTDELQRQRVVPIPEALVGKLHMLNPDKSGSSRDRQLFNARLSKIPTLVLDVDQDVDVTRDLSYSSYIAEQLSLYTKFVKDCHIAKNESRDLCFSGAGR
ncbi:MAG: hypothetical protein WDW38_002697 [Sanguina aurantia]